MAGEVKLKDRDVLINAVSDFVNVGRRILKEAEIECSKGRIHSVNYFVLCYLLSGAL